jgi:hypothetical protein
VNFLLKQKNNNEIFLDLDRTRIKTVLSEAYEACKDTLGVDFDIEQDAFVKGIDIYLDSNRVSIPVQLRLPSNKYPELIIEVNPRRKSVFARMANRDKQILLNRYLTKL